MNPDINTSSKISAADSHKEDIADTPGIDLGRATIGEQSLRPVRPRAIGGFPEWLPEQRAIEQSWMDRLRSQFERFGFMPIETRSIEEVAVLQKKGGDSDKQMYEMKSAHTERGDSQLFGMHFDLTVPFARYVAQHRQELPMPFKRYQIQKVWRGETPQQGRFREFYQCDIDVVNPNALPLHFDAEVAEAGLRAIASLGVGKVGLGISNRRILDGYLQGIGVFETVPAMRIIDKLPKLGPENTTMMLERDLGLTPELAVRCLDIAAIRSPLGLLDQNISSLGITNDLMEQGLNELKTVLKLLDCFPDDTVYADLSLARGFDYYTGTVFEGSLVEFPEIGAVVSGGRYENLISNFSKESLPGVGLSIGMTRLFHKMLEEGRLELPQKSPTQILVMWFSEEQYPKALAMARVLRASGVNTEIYHSLDKPRKAMEYALKKGIPNVLFIEGRDEVGPEIKNLSTGIQEKFSFSAWGVTTPSE